MLLAACSMQIHAPTISHDPKRQNKPWRIHCETARTHAPHSKDVPATAKSKWIFAQDTEGKKLAFEGKVVDGFFEVDAVHNPSSGRLVPSRLTVRQLCIDTIEMKRGNSKLMLGWVMAVRSGEKVNIPPVYPDEMASGDEVTRVVVFGDSLTDTGRLKHRLKIFPAKPYWIGRFSNGPVWPEYLAMATGMGVQNHAYGGASASVHDAQPGVNFYARIKEVGQFFVTGTIKLQIDDYIQRTLADGSIERADTTAFLLWAGANDYISKEPVTGIITTFLNSPEGESGYRPVVELVVAQLVQHVRTLYDAGARKFVVMNLPDLGLTPIVLQNKTYTPKYEKADDSARRIELARRLTELSLYHNQLLKKDMNHLEKLLAGSEILLADTFGFFHKLLEADGAVGSSPQQYGYDLALLEKTLEYEDSSLSVQQRCYRGSYMGRVNTDKICSEPGKAVFWDAVHPTTLTHCWQAWKVGQVMAGAAWTDHLPDSSEYLGWCQQVVQHVTSKSLGHFVTRQANPDSQVP